MPRCYTGCADWGGSGGKGEFLLVSTVFQRVVGTREEARGEAQREPNTRGQSTSERRVWDSGAPVGTSNSPSTTKRLRNLLHSRWAPPLTQPRLKPPSTLPTSRRVVRRGVAFPCRGTIEPNNGSPRSVMPHASTLSSRRSSQRSFPVSSLTLSKPASVVLFSQRNQVESKETKCERPLAVI